MLYINSYSESIYTYLLVICNIEETPNARLLENVITSYYAKYAIYDHEGKLCHRFQYARYCT